MGFDHRLFEDDWADQLNRLSLGWVTARDSSLASSTSFWDGFVRAFIEDTAVARRAQRQGIGARLIEVARQVLVLADVNGFTPTNAGLIRL